MNAALIVFNSMTALDFVGFYDPVTRLKRMEIMPQFRWTICARTPTVTDDHGLTFVADSVGESLAAYDLLFIPGGIGTRALQADAGFLEWLRSFPSAQLATSVCTGALLLGAAGSPPPSISACTSLRVWPGQKHDHGSPHKWPIHIDRLTELQ